MTVKELTLAVLICSLTVMAGLILPSSPTQLREPYNYTTVTHTTTIEVASTTQITLVETSAIPKGNVFFVWWAFYDLKEGDALTFQTNGLIKLTGPRGETAYEGGETTLLITETGTYRAYITVGHGLLLYIRIYRTTAETFTQTLVTEQTQTISPNQTTVVSNSTSHSTSITLNSTLQTVATNATSTPTTTVVPGFGPTTIIIGSVTALLTLALTRKRISKPAKHVGHLV